MGRRLWIIAALALLTAHCATETPKPRPHLDAAIDVAKWLRTTVVETDYGSVWPDDRKKPGEISVGLGSGVAGRIMFFRALYDATRDETYLDDIHLGADYLVNRLPDYLEDTTVQRTIAGLYSGLPGIGFALNEAYIATRDPRYHEAALQCVVALHRLARSAQTGSTWNGRHDILSGGAGSGLFLLYAEDKLNQDPSAKLAAQTGDWLLAESIPESGGLTWTVGSDMNIILPNFSHGAAGIGSFFARLYMSSKRQEYLDGAIGAAAYLSAIASRDDDGFLVPYGIPNVGFTRPFDVGWAHGPSGTARLFESLWQATGDSMYLEIVFACANSVIKSGLPDSASDAFAGIPFGQDMRFGAAGSAMFLLDLHDAHGGTSYREFARTLAEDILADAVRDSLGTRWLTPRFEFMPHPREPAEFTDYFYGAAGYGLLLLRLDATEEGRGWKTGFPDNPFGHSRRR
jgi:lantibiotic modifying enzyme